MHRDANQLSLSLETDSMSLTLDQLDRHLFKCADIIRHTVDKTDYKDFILPLVFYKVISDTYQDEFEKWKEELGEEAAQDPELYDFSVPSDYAWEELRNLNTEETNRDEFINEALSAITDANPEKLEGVFRADYIRADALDNAKLGSLVEHLSTYNLSAKRIPPDMLGEAYMDLVRHFAEEEGKDGGEFFTPPNLVNLMVRLVAPFEDGETFHDPTCGSAGFLVEAARYYREEQDGDESRLEFTGQELNPDIAAIAKMNLFIHGLKGEVVRGDSLADPGFTANGHLQTYDVVLANFPFSADWPKDDLQDDKFNRFGWHEKLPRADRGDYAFIMHMVSQLSETGRAAIVIPHGVLFRKREKRYRKPLVEQDLIEAVIGLPANLFQNNSIPSAILLLNRDKAEERRGEILFLHADEEVFYEELSNQNRLTNEGIDYIVNNILVWKEEEKVSYVETKDEVIKRNYDLTISLYVDTTKPESPVSVDRAVKSFTGFRESRDDIESRLDSYIRNLSYSCDENNTLKDLSGVDPEKVETSYPGFSLWPQLPGEWSLKIGKDICSVNPTYDAEGQIIYIEMDALSEELPFPKYHGWRNPSEHSGRMFSEGDTLFARITPCTENGKAAFIDSIDSKVGIGSTEFIVLSPDKTVVHPWYLYYMAKSYPVHEYAVSRMRGSTGRQRVPNSLFRDEVKFPIPPLAEQKKIASILLTVDYAMSFSATSSLRSLRQGLMQDLLTGRVRTAGKDIDILDEVAAHG
jgi:type I restriction enzyme M protein